MKPFLLILSALCLWQKLAMGVIQNGVVTFDPIPGATRYTLWSVLPNQTIFRLEAIATTNRITPGPLLPGTTLYVRSIAPGPAGTFIESDLGHVVTPPETVGTNVIRLIVIGPTKVLQGATGAAGPWTDLAEITNPPVQLNAEQRQMFRLKTVAPPLPGGATH